MSAQATEPLPPRPAMALRNPPSAEAVDESCRWPVLFLAGCSLLWLLFSLVMAVLASVKSHAPGMLDTVPALTFGRVAGVASSAFYYGFASQAGIAIALWLFARMGRTLLVIPRVSLVAGIIWNLGVFVGLGGIFAGEMTHYPAFEMPPSLFPVLFVSYALLGIAAVLTFNARTERDVYPSNWFLFAAVFVFPWIYSAAGLMLGDDTTRGVLQPVISTWFFNNFLWLWLGLLALGIITYFIPKLSAQPLHSRGLAVFGFWFFVLFATGSGFQNIAGLPNWMPNVSRVINLLLLVPALALALNWHRTWKARSRQKAGKDPAAGYIVFSALAFIASILLLVFVSCPAFNETLGFSIFVPGLIELIIYGFVSMAFLGAIVYIVPRLTNLEWPKSGLTAWHYRLSVAGIVICVLAMLGGGFVHGSAMENPAVDFLSAVRRAVPFIGVNTIGLLIFALAQVLLLLNMGSTLKNYWAACCGARRKEETR